MRKSGFSAPLILTGILFAGGCASNPDTISRLEHEQLIAYGLVSIRNYDIELMKITLNDNTGPHYYELDDNGRYIFTTAPECPYCIAEE